jgi:glycosyltransferase involved in cell wall biosynthesis
VLRSGVPIAIDLYDPMHLEALQRETASAELPHVLNLVIDQLRRGDYFFCASERQRDYWLGMLSSLGRVTPEAYAEDPDLRSLIDVVPYGISAQPPQRVGAGPRDTVEGIGPDDVLLVWNGGLWDWFDTQTFLHALAQVRDELPMLRAYFMGVRRPGSTELGPAAVKVMALSDELGLTGKTVFFNDWTPFDRRQDVYLDATAIVSLHHAHLESRFSFRTRLLDALWGRVPIVCTSGDVVAGIVEELQLGLTVPAGDVDAVVQAFRDIVADPALLERARVRLEAAAPAYEWSHAVKPLAAWLTHPARRSDHVVVSGLRAVDARQARRDDLERYANELKLLVPTPVRQHVLGPVKRGLRSTVRTFRPG